MVDRINTESRARIMDRLKDQKTAKGKSSSTRKAPRPKLEEPLDDIQEFMKTLREYVELE